MKGKLNKLDNGWMLLVDNGIYATDENEPYDRLSVKNCESIEIGYDLDELAEKHYGVHIKQGHTEEDSLQRKIDFILGFVSAIKLNENKLFTLEDMMNCWNKALTFQDHKELFGHHIQSLKQTEWDVEIVEEQVYDGLDEMAQPQYVKQPKLDEKGQLILKRK